MQSYIILVIALMNPPSSMVDGIESIPVLGTPGTMAVWGEQAFPVIVGKDKSQPIAAAATFGDGRFFAIAHGSYVGGVLDGTATVFIRSGNALWRHLTLKQKTARRSPQ